MGGGLNKRKPADIDLVLKLTQEALSLDEGLGTAPSTEPRLKGLPHTKTRPYEIYSQVSVSHGDLNLPPPGNRNVSLKEISSMHGRSKPWFYPG